MTSQLSRPALRAFGVAVYFGRLGRAGFCPPARLGGVALGEAIWATKSTS